MRHVHSHVPQKRVAVDPDHPCATTLGYRRHVATQVINIGSTGQFHVGPLKHENVDITQNRVGCCAPPS